MEYLLRKVTYELRETEDEGIYSIYRLSGPDVFVLNGKEKLEWAGEQQEARIRFSELSDRPWLVFKHLSTRHGYQILASYPTKEEAEEDFGGLLQN